MICGLKLENGECKINNKEMYEIHGEPEVTGRGGESKDLGGKEP